MLYFQHILRICCFKSELYPGHFTSTLHDPVCLVGIILRVNTVCTYKMVQNIILMNESQEVGGLRNLLAAVVCQTSAAEKKIKSLNK